MERLLWICLGGALGTGARYLVGQWAGARFGGALPWGTLAVNVTGCFLMGLVAHAAFTTASLSPTLRLALTTGFLGGLTTYSAFNHETMQLLQGGAPRPALTYLASTVLGCLAAGLAGLLVARRLF
jgi:CrcB protein